MYACMFALRSTVVPSLLVIFTVTENFWEFSSNVKFPEYLQPYNEPHLPAMDLGECISFHSGVLGRKFGFWSILGLQIAC